MKKFIKQGALCQDDWQALQWGEGESAVVPESGKWVVPLAVWREQRSQLLARKQSIGVQLEPADDPAALAGDTGALEVVAVNFPVFTDGRGFSTARLLRERLGFKGELRAVGDVSRDQIFLLARCGFDAFLLREGEDGEGAIAALKDFSEVYQAANDRGPLFDRRFGQRVARG